MTRRSLRERAPARRAWVLAVSVTVAGGVAAAAFVGCSLAAEVPAGTLTVRVAPVVADLGVGGTLKFFGAVQDSRASSSVKWIADPGGGTIDADGNYTAPATPGVYRVTAVAAADEASRASATVRVVEYPAGATYALPAERTTAWKPGVTLNGGIPDRTTVCATLDAATFGNGSQNATSAIQAAIDACPDGQVVSLSAGTFLVNDLVLVHKGITLRGAGADATTLYKSNGAKPLQDRADDAQPIVIVGPSRWPKTDDAASQDLAADGDKGAFTVTVANGSVFKAGGLALLDELSGAGWQLDPLGRGKIWAPPDWRLAWQFHLPGQSFDDPLTAGSTTGGGAASWFCRPDRPTAEMKEVASVDGNAVTFTTPLHIAYRKGHKAQLTPLRGASNEPVRMAGVERLKAVGGSDGAIRFESAAYSWARNVEVTQWLGEGFSATRSFRVEIRDSWVHDGVWSEPGGAGYALSLSVGSAELLFENNISMMANKVMVARCAGAGSVVGYNYVDDGFIMLTEGWIEAGLNASHMVGPHHVLFEGNDGFNFESDKTHGSSSYHTVFRNALRCWRRPFVNPRTGHTVDDAASSNGPKRCIGSCAYSYWMSFVGNVLGTKDQMSGFTYDSIGSRSMTRNSVWLLGWDEVAPYAYDPAVAATAIRDGNWDWLQAKQSWHNAPPLPLPDSLYLPGKPAFFGASPWPWVDPATGTLKTLPARARYDAGTPNAVSY